MSPCSGFQGRGIGENKKANTVTKEGVKPLFTGSEIFCSYKLQIPAQVEEETNEIANL